MNPIYHTASIAKTDSLTIYLDLHYNWSQTYLRWKYVKPNDNFMLKVLVFSYKGVSLRIDTYNFRSNT